jgi:hypothetical protein
LVRALFLNYTSETKRRRAIFSRRVCVTGLCKALQLRSATRHRRRTGCPAAQALAFLGLCCPLAVGWRRLLDPQLPQRLSICLARACRPSNRHAPSASLYRPATCCCRLAQCAAAGGRRHWRLVLCGAGRQRCQAPHASIFATPQRPVDNRHRPYITQGRYLTRQLRGA